MRLLIATGLYPPDIGGPATYTKFLEKHLPQSGHSYCTVPFSTVRRFPRIIRHCMYMVALFRVVRICDVIYALDAVSVGIPAMIVSMVTRKQFYLRIAGDYAWEQGQQRFGITETLDEYLMKRKRHPCVRVLAWLQYCVAHQAAQIVVPSEYMKRVVVTWGINPQKITRIYTELKVINVDKSKETLRAEFDYNCFVAITAARLVPWKGVKAVIDAVGILRANGINASLEVAGDGTSRAELELHVKQQGTSGHVHFRGTLTREELGKRIRAADVFVLNTSYEGFSHQLLEVMSIGTPIVTTPVGGNTELISPNVEGIIVQWNDLDGLVSALTRLYGDYALRQSLTEHARRKVKQFHEDVVIRDFLKLLQ